MAVYELTMRVRVDDGLAFHDDGEQQDLCDNAADFVERFWPGSCVDVVAKRINQPQVRWLPIVKNERRALLSLVDKTPW